MGNDQNSGNNAKIRQKYLKNASLVQPSNNPSNSKQKQLLINQIQKLMTEKYTDRFNKAIEYFNIGKISKGEQLITPILGQQTMDNLSQKIAKNFPKKTNNVPQLTISKYLYEKDGIKHYRFQTESNLSDLRVSQSQFVNVISVGMMGAGKNTFLSSFVSYLMDVEMDDDFRYDIFEDNSTKKTTTVVNIYKIPKQSKLKKTIQLINITGLENVDNLNDTEHIDTICKSLRNSVPSINLIMLIFKASQTRLTMETDSAMNQIMSMFAKDVKNKILFVFTFADTKVPNVITLLEDNKTFKGIIIQKKNKNEVDWYLKVNSSALLKKIDPKNQVDVSFYKMGTQCIQKIVQKIQNSQPISTYQTINVIEKRIKFKTILNELQKQVNLSVTQQKQLKTIVDKLEYKPHKKTIPYKIKYKQKRQFWQNTSKPVSTCLTCQKKCHQNCKIEKYQSLQQCSCMFNNKCRHCNCSNQSHIIQCKSLKWQQVDVEITNQEYFQLYQQNNQNNEKDQYTLVTLLANYIYIVDKIHNYCKQIQKINNDLSQIALYKNNGTTASEEIQLFIVNEKYNKKQGYNDRIKEYQLIKTEEQKYQNDSIQNLMKERIKNLSPNNKSISELTVNAAFNKYQGMKQTIQQQKPKKNFNNTQKKNKTENGSQNNEVERNVQNQFLYNYHPN